MLRISGLVPAAAVACARPYLFPLLCASRDRALCPLLACPRPSKPRGAVPAMNKGGG